MEQVWDWGKTPYYAQTDRFGDEAAHVVRSATVAPGSGNAPLLMDITVPCRACTQCLRVRARLWKARMVTEVNCASRSWFGTITLDPGEHFRVMCEAERDLPAGVRWECLNERDQFAARHRVISRKLTLWAKRLRKSAGPGLRFIAVGEAHKSGLPHYHVMVHEPHEGGRCTERMLSKSWPHGFTQWRVIKDPSRAAAYVAKYLFKANLARVRASLRYGEASHALRHRTAPTGAPVTPSPSPEKNKSGGETETTLRSEKHA